MFYGVVFGKTIFNIEDVIAKLPIIIELEVEHEIVYLFLLSCLSGVEYFKTFIFLQENIECDFELVTTSPAAMVMLMDRSAQQLLVCSLTFALC